MFSDFLASKKFKVLLAILVLLAGFMAYAGANGRLSAAPQELLAAALVPFQKLSAIISGGFSGFTTKYTQIDSVISSNEALEKRVSELENQLVEYDRIKMENEQYKQLYNISQELSEFKITSGSVIARDPMERFSSFTLDVGSTSNVEKYDIVISSTRSLIGQVIEVGPNWCKVITVIDPSINAAAIVSRTRDTGVITGSPEHATTGQCIMTNVPRETMATSGDLIATTGLGGVFPKDIIVGTIKELYPETSGNSLVAVIEPSEDVARITMAFVITEFNQ